MKIVLPRCSDFRPLLRSRDSWDTGTTSRAEELTIAEEPPADQGSGVDLGGYYRPDPAKAAAVMRPSKTFNETLSLLGRS